MEIQWPLIVFTLFTCLAAGTFAIQGVLALLGKGARVQLPALIVSFASLVVAGVASFTHLQHWERAFNGFGHITSGITQELIGIVVMVVAIVVYFVVSRKGETPKWAGAVAVIVGIGMVIVMTTSYMMPARPVWSTPALYLYYFSQALLLGGAAVWTVASVQKDEDVTALGARLTALGGIVVIVALAVYAGVISSVQLSEVGNYFDPTHPTKEMANTSDLLGELISGGAAVYFWVALIAGGVASALLGIFKWRAAEGSLAFAVVVLICALAGGLAFRAALYVLGASVFVFY
jgi:anaerobic dimethyl sulfoxide reductase subunit C (anchor subunit)